MLGLDDIVAIDEDDLVFLADAAGWRCLANFNNAPDSAVQVAINDDGIRL